MQYYGTRGSRYILMNTNHNGVSGPLATGGEGSVYEVEGHKDIVIKIYARPEPSMEKKLTVMMKNPPTEVVQFIAWPIDVVRDKKGKFSGFVMKKIAKTSELVSVYKYIPGRKGVVDTKKKVTIALNICYLLRRLHERGYVVADFNPSNIGVDICTGTCHVYLFDCDSFHVKTRTSLYPCKVCLPGYVAPELIKKVKQYGGNYESTPQPTFNEHTDRFSIAIHIYKLLFSGYSPFNGIKDNLTVSQASIGTGNIPIERDAYAWKPGNKPISVAVPNMNEFPKYIQDMFEKAFISGRVNPSVRPSPLEWENVLKRYLSEMTNHCSKGHFYHTSLKKCPYCSGDERYIRINRAPAKTATAMNSGYRQINTSGNTGYASVSHAGQAVSPDEKMLFWFSTIMICLLIQGIVLYNFDLSGLVFGLEKSDDLLFFLFNLGVDSGNTGFVLVGLLGCAFYNWLWCFPKKGHYEFKHYLLSVLSCIAFMVGYPLCIFLSSIFIYLVLGFLGIATLIGVTNAS